MSAVSVVSLSGCSTAREPCAGVSERNKYELLVGPVLSERPAEQMCVDDWGFAAGNVFEAEIVDVADGDGDSCGSGIPRVSGNGGWKLDLNSQQFTAGGLLLEGQYAIANDTCSGRASLTVVCYDQCQYSGAACACQLSLNLIGSKLGCPPVCNVATSVAVSKL